MPWRVSFSDEPADVVWTDEPPDGVRVFRNFGLAREAALQDLSGRIRELKAAKGNLQRLRARDRAAPQAG